MSTASLWPTSPATKSSTASAPLVTKDVLVPGRKPKAWWKPAWKRCPNQKTARFADIGTGSGAILVAVAVHRPYVRAYGTDISRHAIEVAQQNCDRHGISDRVSLSSAAFLSPSPNP